MVAYESTSAYRRMWDYQREDRAVGPRPVEPVQRLDWEIARADIAALNLADTPARVTADGSEQLRALAAEGDLAAQILGDIRDADDALFTARITALGAEQAAADALVRARIARRDGRTDAAVLIDRADQASKDADLAQAALTQAQDALRTRTAAGPAMRERARLAMAAAGEVERRTKSGETGLGWREREFGRLPDGRLEAAVAAARASTAAIRSQLEHITAQTSGPASRFPGLAPTAADAERLEAQAVYLRAVLDQTQAQVEGFEREARIRLNVAPGRREAEQSARAVIATASSAPQSRPEPVHEQNGDLISSAVDSAGHALT